MGPGQGVGMGKLNGLDYSLVSRINGTMAVNISKENVPKHVFDYADTKTSSDFVMVMRRLPSEFSAKVRRNGRRQGEKVFLRSGGKEIIIPRDSDDDPHSEGLSVSCDPGGREVKVDSINIEFREYRDLFTDRGIVWVHDGHPATANFILAPHAFSLSEQKLLAILDEAEKAVEEKVLVHFR